MGLKTFQCYMADAPELLDQIALLLQECQEKEILLPDGIRNLCDLSWEELSELPPDAKPLHQARMLSKPSRPYSTPCNLPLDTRLRMSIVPSQAVLLVDSNMSVRPVVARFSTLKFKRRFQTDREYNGTCVPVTSTLRLYLEDYLSHLSFSLSYKDSSSVSSTNRLSIKTLEVCRWAVNKLKPILDQIEEEKARLEVKGCTCLLLTRHYQDYRFRQPPPQIQPYAGDSLFPLIPITKYLGYSVSLKLHYRLPDGSCFVYYPSGSVAVCQIPSAQSRGAMYTHIFEDSPHDSLLASFMPSGRGFVYHPGKPTTSGFALLVGTSGGRQYSRDGYLTKEWTSHPRTLQEDTHTFKLNEIMSLTFSKQLAINLNVTVLNENVSLKVRRNGNVDPGEEEGEPISTDTEVYRAELQVLRKRVKHTALRWLHFYMVAAGLSSEPILPDLKFTSVTHKETSPPKIHLTTEESPPAVVRPAPLKRKFPRPSTCNLPMSRPVHLFKPASHRVKSAGLPCASPVSDLPLSETPLASCPVALRLLLLNSAMRQGCHCSTRLPVLSDLELELFLRAPWAPQGHVLVVYVTSSICPPPQGQSVEVVLQRVHHKQVHASAMPCAKSSQDPFRLVKYDIDTATRQTQTLLPVLVRRHNVRPGILLMYAGGKLIFGGSALNGYGFSKTNLLKQIAKTQSDYTKGTFLPQDYKLGGWEVKIPPQVEAAGHSRGDGHVQDPPCRSQSSCSHVREIRFPPHRYLEGTALDFVVSSMSDRVSILAMKSKTRLARPSTP